jgi:hypothetical protein
VGARWWLVAVAVACVAVSVVGQSDLEGSLRVDLEASETSLLVVRNLSAVVSLIGEMWRTSGRLLFTGGEFSSFGVTDVRAFGPFQLRSTCVFNPDIGFSHLSSTARFTLLGVQWGNYVFLSKDPSSSYDQLTARWTEGGISLSGVWRVGLCPLEFRDAQAAGQWYIPSCDLFMDVRSAFTCADGFDYLRVTGRFPRVPFLSNDVIETELRLTIQFEVDGKTFSPALRMKAGRINACMTPYVRVVEGASFLELDGVAVYGWTVGCSIGESVEALFATSLDPASNQELTGDAVYWEAWKLRGAVESCCGRDLLWALSTYFGEPTGTLFSWGLTTVSADIPLGESLTARIGAKFAATSPKWVLSAGLELRY